jgi:hypothetical protein
MWSLACAPGQILWRDLFRRVAVESIGLRSGHIFKLRECMSGAGYRVPGRAQLPPRWLKKIGQSHHNSHYASNSRVVKSVYAQPSGGHAKSRIPRLCPYNRSLTPTDSKVVLVRSLPRVIQVSGRGSKCRLQDAGPLQPVHNLKPYMHVQGTHQIEHFFRAAALDVDKGDRYYDFVDQENSGFAPRRSAHGEG